MYNFPPGLHHQGVFRVSGAQVDINQFKATFESGEDALADVVDASDINSVAGVLKLYFRELREPLFPLHLFDALVECTRKFASFIKKRKMNSCIATMNIFKYVKFQVSRISASYLFLSSYLKRRLFECCSYTCIALFDLSIYPSQFLL